MGGWVDGWMGVFKDCVDGWVQKLRTVLGRFDTYKGGAESLINL
jgi:hypothetical protein